MTNLIDILCKHPFISFLSLPIKTRMRYWVYVCMTLSQSLPTFGTNVSRCEVCIVLKCLHIPYAPENKTHFLHTTLRQKWEGRGVCLNIQFISCIHPLPLFLLSLMQVRLTITMIGAAFWKNSSFNYCLLREISGGCVDTKPRGIKATCIISSDRG